MFLTDGGSALSLRLIVFYTRTLVCIGLLMNSQKDINNSNNSYKLTYHPFIMMFYPKFKGYERRSI